ncbi:MAG: hypothetical protein ABJF50_08825 [Paracoccaceae bacterium]
MSHHQLTPFETALLRAVENLNTTFEAGLKSAAASPKEFENLRIEFKRFTESLETRLNDLEEQQQELRRLFETG